jgi:hypothetical protein
MTYDGKSTVAYYGPYFIVLVSLMAAVCIIVATGKKKD